MFLIRGWTLLRVNEKIQYRESLLRDFESLLGDYNPVRSCSIVDARRVHFPNMHFQLQEELTAKKCN